MSKILADNIRYLIAQHGIKSPNELSRRTRIPQPTIFRWLNKTAREPRQSSLKPLADFFGLTVADLTSVDLKTGQVITEAPAGRPRQEVPIIKWDQAKDYPKGVGPSDIKAAADTMPVVNARVSNSAYGLLVPSDSMAPAIPSGSYLVIDPQRSPKPGDYVLAIGPRGRAVILRRYVIEAGAVYLVPENANYQSIQVEGQPEILGVVSEMQVIRSF